MMCPSPSPTVPNERRAKCDCAFHASASDADPGDRCLVATTTVWSGLSYVFSKDAVKILSDTKADKAGQDRNDETKQP